MKLNDEQTQEVYKILTTDFPIHPAFQQMRATSVQSASRKLMVSDITNPRKQAEWVYQTLLSCDFTPEILDMLVETAYKLYTFAEFYRPESVEKAHLMFMRAVAVRNYVKGN